MVEDDILRRRVLIADDELANVVVLEKMLHRAGFAEVRTTTDSRAVPKLHAEFGPDILLLDIHMPGLTGFDLLEQLHQAAGPQTFLPILVLTADTTAETKQRALSAGAKDFLTKPFDQTEVVLRIRNLLETQTLHRQLQAQNLLLEERVLQRTHDLEEARIEILERLSRAAEFRDDSTGQHTQRVGRIAALLAETLGFSEPDVELIRRAAPLHDVGKIGIPDAILLKPGKLSPEEMRIMQTHTTIGANILAHSRSALLQLAERIALTHHECWDGSGYPRGLQGESIDLVGQVASVADVFDALTHERPYKSQWRADEDVAEITRLTGSRFAPHVVDAFLQIWRKGLLETDTAGQSRAASE
jgi:putative two-component system response regulator